MLANSSGDILDDEGLINNLGASKTTSEAIGTRMREAEVTSKEIDETRELYRPVVRAAPLLALAVCVLVCVHALIWRACLQLQLFVLVLSVFAGHPGQHPVLRDRRLGYG